ncbi:hypothetical protein PHISCL_10986, partial [Aspergillus sclerotialis]
TPAPPSNSGKGGGRKSRQKDNDKSEEVGDNQAEGATADKGVPSTGESEKEEKKESLKIRIKLNLQAKVRLDLDADIKGEVVIGLL